MDEAYLEPSHHTLAFSLDLPEEQSPGSAPAGPGGEKGEKGSRDPPSGTVKIPISVTGGDGDGLSGSESGNGEGGDRALEGDYDEVMAESPSREAEEEEENRLLEAGGMLGRRIQQALGEVLEYDCSVGVATNKARTLSNMKEREPFWVEG